MWAVPLLLAAGVGVLLEKNSSSRAPVFALVPQGSDADPPLPLNSYGTILARILASGEVRTLPVQVVSSGAPLTLLLLDPSPLSPVAGLQPGTFIETTRAYVKGV